MINIMSWQKKKNAWRVEAVIRITGVINLSDRACPDTRFNAVYIMISYS